MERKYFRIKYQLKVITGT